MSAQSLTQTPAWKALVAHATEMKKQKIIDLFATEPDRLNRMMLECEGVVFDFSKQCASKKTIDRLCGLAEQEDVFDWLARMFDGDVVNITENNAAHHTMLRDPNASGEVLDALQQMKKITDKVRENKNITDVVHIGVGGSDLGARLVCDALKSFSTGPKIHFVSNVAPEDLDEVLHGLNPKNTFVSVASKSFTTQETILNLKRVQAWIGDDCKDQIVAITAVHDVAKSHGIMDAHILPLWPWVGGRFSVWSCVGFPIAVMLGFDGFQEFLNGAHAADQHVKKTEPQKNIACMMALLGVWNRNFMDASVSAILPYAHALTYLPKYLQQLEMESNGKGVDRDGALVNYATAPVVFGDVGTNGQHAFYQMFHQGTDITPCDFVGVVDQPGDVECNKIIMANMLAQAQALMVGRTDVGPALTCPGNRPSTTILLPRLNARYLGFLLAILEHKTVLQGFLWRINPFDQYGVELGKILAKDLLAPIGELKQNENLDKSTRKLIFHTFARE